MTSISARQTSVVLKQETHITKEDYEILKPIVVITCEYHYYTYEEEKIFKP